MSDQVWLGHFAKGCIPFGFRTTDDAASLLGITQLQLWDLMQAGVVAYMSNDAMYVVREDDVAHLLKIESSEKKAAMI